MPDPTVTLALELADRPGRVAILGGRRHGRTEAMRLASLPVTARAMPGHDAPATMPELGLPTEVYGMPLRVDPRVPRGTVIVRRSPLPPPSPMAVLVSTLDRAWIDAARAGSYALALERGHVRR